MRFLSRRCHCLLQINQNPRKTRLPGPIGHTTPVLGSVPLMIATPTATPRFRPGKFRRHILSEDFLSLHSPGILDELQNYLALWRQGQMSDPELCAVYILLFLKRQRPKDWWSGRRTPLALPRQVGSCHPIDWLTRDASFARCFAKTDATSLLEFFSASHLRGVPASVHHSLQYWAAGMHPLQLRFDIPTPLEVLRLQTEGRRCVSLLIQPEHMTSYLEGDRDPFGFLLHDLIHADHFFSKPRMALQQRGFYRWLWRLLKHENLQRLLISDPDFRADFEYISSDMNSHCLHLLMTLKAKIFEAFSYRPEGEELYQDLISFSRFPSPIETLCRQVNTADFQPVRDARLLEIFFESLA